MRVVLVLLVLAGALFGAGWYLVAAGYGSILLGGLGAVVLLVAACLPRKAKCEGLHCSGCAGH